MKPKRFTPATVANHIEPHRGNEVKFWTGALESVCKPHHDADIQGEETRGYSEDIDPNTGLPTDPRHPFNL